MNATQPRRESDRRWLWVLPVISDKTQLDEGLAVAMGAYRRKFGEPWKLYVNQALLDRGFRAPGLEIVVDGKLNRCCVGFAVAENEAAAEAYRLLTDVGQRHLAAGLPVPATVDAFVGRVVDVFRTQQALEEAAYSQSELPLAFVAAAMRLEA